MGTYWSFTKSPSLSKKNETITNCLIFTEQFTSNIKVVQLDENPVVTFLQLLNFAKSLRFEPLSPRSVTSLAQKRSIVSALVSSAAFA